MCYKWGIAQQHVLTMRHCAAMLNETDCGSCDGAHGVKRWKNRKRCVITVRATPKPASSMAHSTVTRALALWAYTEGKCEQWKLRSYGDAKWWKAEKQAQKWSGKVSFCFRLKSHGKPRTKANEDQLMLMLQRSWQVLKEAGLKARCHIQQRQACQQWSTK